MGQIITQNQTIAHDRLNRIKKLRKKSQLEFTWKRLCRNKGALVGLTIICIFILAMIFADILYDYNTVVIKQNLEGRLMSPNVQHPFGTDEMGRDILARVIHGSRPSLLVSVSSALFALIVGGIVGSIAGFYNEKLSNIIMRIIDVMMAMPAILFALTIIAAFGTSLVNLCIACAFSNIPRFARIMRSSVMSIKNNEYVEAAKAIGNRKSRILLNHVIPNSLSAVFVQFTISVGNIILLLSGLSFLGLGVQPPIPEWGVMLASARTYIRDFSYMCLFPGLAIMLVILSLNLLGDGLRDALDPRLK